MMKTLRFALLGIMAGWLLTSATASGPRALAEDRPSLRIMNGTDAPVQIFWLKSETERVPSGSVAPGKDTFLTTTLGHRFAMVGAKGEETVTSEVRFQGHYYGGVPAFYTQRTDAHGLPIVASARVNPFAVKEAVFIVDAMLAKRPDLRDAIIKSGARISVLAYDEFNTDAPEFVFTGNRSHFPELTDREYWDARGRGTGSFRIYPYTTCTEESLLDYPGNFFPGVCMLIHEMAHCIHFRGLDNVDPTFDTRLRAAFAAAMKAGLWQGSYLSTDYREYFAEGVQCWFDNALIEVRSHGRIQTRAQLEKYDPGLAAICREVFRDTELHYTKPQTRLTGHLVGYDPSKAPTFAWPERLRKARALIHQEFHPPMKSATKADRHSPP